MGNYSKPYKMFSAIMAVFMVVTYAGIGVLFLFFPNIVPAVKGVTRIILGILLLVYAIFRSYRIIKDWTDVDDDDDDE